MSKTGLPDAAPFSGLPFAEQVNDPLTAAMRAQANQAAGVADFLRSVGSPPAEAPDPRSEAMTDGRRDLDSVGYVKRIVFGSQTPSQMKTDEEIEQSMALLNRCLHEAPRGWIIGTEKSFSVVTIGEHQVVLQYTVYHVGFARRPAWLTG